MFLFYPPPNVFLLCKVNPFVKVSPEEADLPES